MADDLDSAIAALPPVEPHQQAAGDVPPPLSSIRVKGPRAKGLNKPIIISVAGGGAAVILVLASGAFNGDASRKPSNLAR